MGRLADQVLNPMCLFSLMRAQRPGSRAPNRGRHLLPLNSWLKAPLSSKNRTAHRLQLHLLPEKSGGGLPRSPAPPVGHVWGWRCLGDSWNRVKGAKNPFRPKASKAEFIQLFGACSKWNLKGKTGQHWAKILHSYSQSTARSPSRRDLMGQMQHPGSLVKKLTAGGTCKGAQHHKSSGKCKSKPQWDISSHGSDWLSSKKNTNNKCWQGCGEKANPAHLVGL